MTVPPQKPICPQVNSYPLKAEIIKNIEKHFQVDSWHQNKFINELKTNVEYVLKPII